MSYSVNQFLAELLDDIREMTQEEFVDFYKRFEEESEMEDQK